MIEKTQIYKNNNVKIYKNINTQRYKNNNLAQRPLKQKFAHSLLEFFFKKNNEALA
jgi:hypothetical protein